MRVLSKDVQGIHHEDIPLAASRKIKVMLIITGLAMGGATNVVLDIASYFNDHADFSVEIISGSIPAGRNDMTYRVYERGIPTQIVPSLVNHIDPIRNLRAVFEISQILARGKYDIVHTHSSVAGVVGRLAAFSAGIPVIIHHVHGWGLHEDMSLGTQTLYLLLERLCASFTDRMIVVSKPDIDKGLAHGIGRKGKFTLIYNGIALNKFRQPVDDRQMRADLGLAPDCKLVGMVGRLDEQKNPLDFIRAAAMVAKGYPNVQFLYVGDGSLRPECEQLISDLQLKDNFFLLGYRDDVYRILPILTVSVMSSLWEGLPITFLESMSAGKPIVANNVDGAKDVVLDGENGYLVEPHRPAEMAERILYLLRDETLCDRMGLVAQHRSNYFSVQRMTGKVESLYRELYANSQPHTEGVLAQLRR